MKIVNSDFKVGMPYLYKLIAVKDLIAILNTLPEDLLVCAQSIGHTGNLGVYQGTHDMVGIIDIGEESYEPIGDDEDGTD